MTENRAYHYEPITPDAVGQVECLTCGFRCDVGPDGTHGHDLSHTMAPVVPVDYSAHPLYADKDDRLRRLRKAQRDYNKHHPGALPNVPQGDA